MGSAMPPSEPDALSGSGNRSVSELELQQLALLRQQRKLRRMQHAAAAAAEAVEPPAEIVLTRGQRLADQVAATIGSWRFILIQSSAILVWIIGNVLTGSKAWDPYPFILLNLLLSFQAAYTAPAIMMSQNRQSELDRRHAQNDYAVNVKAELEIELLHEKIDLMKERELLLLAQAIKDLAAKLESLNAPHK
jgi:uncharacterized membrane protein